MFVTDGGVIWKVISNDKDKLVMIEEDNVNDENQLGFKIEFYSMLNGIINS